MSATATIQDVLEGRSRWAVICADNATVLPGLPDKGVAHVITDPPYEAEAHTLGRRVKRGNVVTPWGAGGETVSEPLDFGSITNEERATIGAEMARISSRWVAAFCQVEATQRWRAAIEAGGHRYKRTSIWVKPDGQPQLSGDRPGMGYESIVLLHAPGRSAWNGGGRCGVFTHCKNNPDGKPPHPTTKPTPLMLELVELFTDPDELVLDPFCGSGTTGVACLRLGRRFIGIERDEKYAAVARERLAAELQGLSLKDARAGQQPLFPEAP